jgi:hypothetical protein
LLQSKDIARVAHHGASQRPETRLRSLEVVFGLLDLPNLEA